MKVMIFGATGMVGKGVLLECLDDARVEHVLLWCVSSRRRNRQRRGWEILWRY